jgi:hypothetical protein
MMLVGENLEKCSNIKQYFTSIDYGKIAGSIFQKNGDF